jgi:hypothetical protein
MRFFFFASGKTHFIAPASSPLVGFEFWWQLMQRIPIKVVELSIYAEFITMNLNKRE